MGCTQDFVQGKYYEKEPRYQVYRGTRFAACTVVKLFWTNVVPSRDP